MHVVAPSKHIVVMKNAHIFYVKVIDDNNVILHPKSIQRFHLFLFLIIKTHILTGILRNVRLYATVLLILAIIAKLEDLESNENETYLHF